MANVSYLSVNRYLQGGYGIALPDGFSRATLRNKLVQATTQVNGYCGVPSQPQAFDFRGGTVTGEQHQWPYIDPLLVYSGTRRVFLNQKPVRTVTGFVLQLAENYTVSLDPATNVVVNRMEGYAEVVALTPVISGYFPVGWNFGLWNPLAVVDYTYGWTFEVVGDECEAESPTVFTASHGNWIDDTATVYLDGVEQGSGYALKLDDGSITFATAPTPGVAVTCDYTYNLPDAISNAVGIVTTDLIAQSRIASRGMIGLQSLRVAEVAITSLQPSQMATKNGVSLPLAAANLLGRYTIGSAA